MKPLAPVTNAVCLIGDISVSRLLSVSSHASPPLACRLSFPFLWRYKEAVPKNHLTILGCGTSTGVPRLFCTCRVCRSKNPKNHRLRASVWIYAQGTSLLLDTSTDLRQQALRARIPRVDAILFTHPHADHLHGIDEIRSFNYQQKGSIDAYGNDWTCREIQDRFKYVLDTERPYPGGGSPKIRLHRIEASPQPFFVGKLPVEAISLEHGRQETLAYRINNVAYVTDCSRVPEAAMARLTNLKLLVLDCLQVAPHATHLHLEQSLALVKELKPRRTVLTHLGHDFDYPQWSRKLPRGVELAYDGLKIPLKEGFE
jgi:phosphoribosyl 1,2-cyclic phosphate phosphodiesterase